MQSVNLNQLLARVQDLSVFTNGSERIDAVAYFEQHRLQAAQAKQRVDRAGRTGAVLGGSGGAAIVGAGFKMGSICGSWAGPVGYAIGAPAGAVVGYVAGKEIQAHREIKRLEASVQYQDWAQKAERHRKVRARTQLRHNLDHIMLARGIVDRNFRCFETKTFMLYPVTAAGGQMFDQSITAVHRPDENDDVTLGQGRVSKNAIVRNLFCHALRTDLLKLRYRFLEELLQQQERHQTWNITPGQSAAIRDLREVLKTKFWEGVSQVLEQAKQQILLTSNRLNDHDLTEMVGLVKQMKATRFNPDYYPNATEANQDMSGRY